MKRPQLLLYIWAAKNKFVLRHNGISLFHNYFLLVTLSLKIILGKCSKPPLMVIVFASERGAEVKRRLAGGSLKR